jgi:Alpha/beta hydrolase domain
MRSMRRRWLLSSAVLFATASLIGAGATLGSEGHAAATTSCDPLLPAQQEVHGHLIGPNDCQITAQSTVPDSRGRPFDRVDISISGTAFGYVDPVTVGNTRKDVTEVPNILFPQFGITQWEPAVAQYAGGSVPDEGTGITVLYPDAASGTPWNGKAFFITHGQANNTPLGTLVPRNASDGFDPNTFDNLYAGLMIDKGYAVVYARRPAQSGVPATLDDGTKLDESLNDDVGLMLSFLQTGENLIKERLGRDPSGVYFYGHSAGAIVGRLINYGGLNFRPDGSRYFDGFMFDDTGGGLPLPVSMPEGQVLGESGRSATFDKRDVLFQTTQARTQFTKQIDLSHGLYLDTHVWLPDLHYLDLKRQNTLLLQQQGLGSKNRMYELRAVSHISATTTSPPKTLDVGGVADAVIDLLDRWVRDGVAPPPDMSDLPALGGQDGHHRVSGAMAPSASTVTQALGVAAGQQSGTRNHAIALPPIACPTGVRFPWPPPDGSAQTTGYVPYDGTSLEPVDSRGFLDDLNGNGVRDPLPAMQQAWRQLGLVGPNQTLTTQAYVACVTRSVDVLVGERLLSRSVASWYIDQSRQFPNVPW